MSRKAEKIVGNCNILGEGPFSVFQKRLFWFDIFDSCAYCLEIAENKTDRIKLNAPICCAGITVQNEIVAAGSIGVAVYNDKFQQTKLLFPPPFDTGKLRFNDGKVGPDGAFWVGVMTHEGDKPEGMLLRITDKIECILENMLIPNGLGWSPDGKKMYITDTGFSLISKWDFNTETGSITGKETFVSSAEMNGAPDGLTVDSTGNVWSAFWGGSRVCCFTPSGKLIDEIITDAKNPTSCCFAGVDNSTLYITSARYGLDDPEASDGALFRVSTDSVGLSQYKFRY